MTLLQRVCRALDQAGITHALIGAAALAARGVARSTYDVDLLTSDPRVLIGVCWEDLAAAGVGVDIRRGDADDPLGGVVRIERAGERPVDVVLGKDAWQRRAIERAERIGDGPPVVLARDLVLLKLYAGGSQDLWDVRELLGQPDADALVAAVTADLTELPRDMQDRWTQTRG